AIDVDLFGLFELLNGFSYVRWAQSMKLFIGGREKIGFLLGTEKGTAKSDPKVLRLWGCIMRDFDRLENNYLIMIASSNGKLAYHVQRVNPDFEYAQIHLLDRTHFPTLEEAYAYCLSDQSRRSPIPSETSAMVVRYAYPIPASVPSQTSHTSSPSLSPLPAASGNSRPLRKKCDYFGKDI
ncbi:hypothetical protein GIB67_042175, partial [Kingdonia uniflora]